MPLGNTNGIACLGFQLTLCRHYYIPARISDNYLQYTTLNMTHADDGRGCLSESLSERKAPHEQYVRCILQP